MLLEMWLSQGDDKLRFPVTPFFRVSEPWNNQEEMLNEIGTINITGKKGLQSTQIESFFPKINSGYTFLTFNDNIPPYDYVNKIKKWRNEGKPLRFLITETPHNFLVLIGNFDSGEQDGSGDLNFTMELKEYVDLGGGLKEEKPKREVGKTPTVPNTTDNKVYKDYVIKKGDTLWDIAKRFYKNPNKQPELYERNKKVIGSNPHKIYPGQVIKV